MAVVCAVHDLCSVSPQFSALYPEMVDALIFLDCYGFLPTDSVNKHSTFKNKKMIIFCGMFSYNIILYGII